MSDTTTPATAPVSDHDRLEPHQGAALADVRDLTSPPRRPGTALGERPTGYGTHPGTEDESAGQSPEEGPMAESTSEITSSNNVKDVSNLINANNGVPGVVKAQPGGVQVRGGAPDAHAPIVDPEHRQPSYRHVWVAPVDGAGPPHAGLLHSWHQIPPTPEPQAGGWAGRVTYLVQVPDREPVLVTQIVDAALITPARTT